METENTQAFSSSSQPYFKSDLPNATAVLICGILSIPMCFCYGIVGMILGVIALVLGNKAVKLYNTNPEAFTPGSLKNTKAGRVCGIIGLSLGALYLILTIVFLAIGFNSESIQEMLNNYK